MVQVTLRVRPTSAYHAPQKVETITIDSHERLEKIQEKYSTAGNGSKTRLYFVGIELPLNSSVGSQNFSDNDVLECCRSPAISAALSACMKDLEEVKKLSYSRRHPGVLKQLLQVSTDVRNNSEHSIWVSNNWTDEKIKSRTINFAIMKAIIQRKDRYAVHDLPPCNDCQSLYEALQSHNVWRGGGDNTASSRAFRSQEHIFKPLKNNGEQSTNWILLWKKLDIMKRIQRDIQRIGYDSNAEDYIEEFVRRDSDRHRSVSATITDEDAYLATHLNSLASSSSPARSSLPPRHNQQQQQQQQQQPTRSRNGSSTSSALMDLSTPPRSTSRQSSSASSSVTPRTRQSRVYFPQYASGPFSVLAALHLAMHAKFGRRLLSLTEDELKRYAQRRCRSNLYDKGRIRGRSAFACVDGLVEKQLVRKEIIRDRNRDEIEKWGLLTKGERLGQFCADFDRAVQAVIPDWTVETTLRGGSGSATTRMNLTLCLDNREDNLFLRRLKQSCEDENVSFVERDLPAGDYLFLDQSGMQESVLPVVIERKSWSDLADSVLGKGRAAQRLECVKLGSHSNECSGNCQLDKMKRCGCSKILFIVEGERCLGSDRLHRSAPKCTPEKCCSACKSLEERHGIRQGVLEGVLTRLQVEHGCYIHYTKCFNETSQSLFDMRSLLQSSASFSEDKLSYDTYASNARRGSNDENQSAQMPNEVHDVEAKALATIIKDRKWERGLMTDILGIGDTNQRSVPSNSSSRPRKRGKPSEAIVLDDSDGCIEMLDSNNASKRGSTTQSGRNEHINVDCIDLSESQDPIPRPPPPSDDGCIDLCDDSQEIGVSHIRGGGYGSDDDSCIDLMNESQDSLPPPDCKDSPKRQKRAASSSSLGDSFLEEDKRVLIVREWSEYDTNLNKMIENIWKEMQAAANVTDDYDSQSQQNDIYAESIVKLKTLVGNQDFPIVPRRYLMAFTLYMQIVLGVQVRSVQRVEFADQIKQSLEKSGSLSLTSTFTPAPSRASFSRSREELSAPKASSSVPRASSNQLRDSSVSKASFAAASMKRPAATSRESDLVREARLKRFGQTSNAQSSSVQPQPQKKRDAAPSPVVSHTDKWECTKCTMKNDKDICDACEAWRCSACTYVNMSSAILCSLCSNNGPAAKGSAVANLSSSYDAVSSTTSYYPSNSMKPSPSYNRSASEVAQKPEDGAKKPKVCGACGQSGHNRANATQYNCSAYYDQKEVDRREKLERKRLEKLDAERQKIARLEREESTAAEQFQEWVRQTEKIKESHEQADEYRKEELKRAKQKKARMEKQQQRRNNGY